MEQLFGEGRHASAAPLKIIWLQAPLELSFPASAMFVVPKRNFKKAHDRNKLKRRMKEAYRLNKPAFYAKLAEQKTQLVLAILYTGRKPESYNTIENACKKLMTACLRP